ncbi:calcium uniporter protein 6, mitochondrial [Selaginella moellendorffii]|nr:calcium uniporter protein 6, mitochondrial [Selaginella moellendorffii]|eukprot:XP_002967578.2 calcium uniporter protein 6, mitochondrial [Selaginella moellendorffii]
MATRALAQALGRRGGGYWRRILAPASPRVILRKNAVDSWGFLRQARFFCDEVEKSGGEGGMTVQEAKRLIRQVNVQALKKQLHTKECPCIDYTELASLCKEMGLADSSDEARKLVLAMDEAGEIVLFRNKVYLDAQEIAELVSRALPLRLVGEDDPRVKEFEELHDRKESIDEIADRQVRKFLWVGLLALTGGTGLFVRLTFWELSWDVMEPIAFFMTTGFIIAGYAYFLFSRRDPTYQGLMHSLLASRRRRLMRRMGFDYQKYKALEKQCITTCKLNKPAKHFEHDEDD